MSRYDNEDLNDLNIPDPPKRTETFLGAGGEETDINNSFAKVLNVDGNEAYFIWFGRGDLFDPWGSDRLHRNRPYYSFKKVNGTTFNYYIKYLKSQNNLYLTRARRSSMEE